MRPLPPAFVLGLCACLWALAPSRVAAHEPWERKENPESGPELILPGDHEVQPGEWIELRWTRADRIRELEILLSLDGGRHYPVCISPQLDPGRCSFRWRVPERPGELRMRIRFNRDGHEIEGAPTAPLRVAAGDRERPQPLGLPPAQAEGGSGETRSPGQRSEGPQSRIASAAFGPRTAPEPRRPAASASALALAPRACPPGAGCPMPFHAPRSLPLRS